MKKIVLCLLSVLAWMNANAAYIDSNGVLYLYGAGHEMKTSSGDNDAVFDDITAISGWKDLPEGTKVNKIKFIGDFTAGWGGGWLINAGASAPTAVTTIDMSEADFSGTAKWEFNEFNNLTEIIWPTADHITNIPCFAFKWSSAAVIETLTIPGYIETINSQAFDFSSEQRNLKKIVFEEYDKDNDGVSDVKMSIATQAFSNCYGVTDVYINTTGNIDAAYNAFPHWITYAHADTGRDTARLHFPESKYDVYVNTDHTLNEATAADNKLFQEWLVEHYNLASTSASKTGWWEFVYNGSSAEPDHDMGDVVLYTFSHATIDYIVPKGAKAYIVTGISESDKLFSVNLKAVNVIPHGTGVIIFGGTNSTSAEGKRSLEMTAVKYTGPGAYNRKNKSGDDFNLLVGTATADGAATHVDPYETENNKVTHRNFAMGKFSSTDSGKKYYKDKGNYGTGDGLDKGNFVGFFRLKSSNIASGKAYLRLEDTEYTNAEGGEVIVPKDENYSVEYKINAGDQIMSETEMQEKGYWYTNTSDSNSKITWEGSWGTRNLESGFTMASFFGEPFFEEPTAIRSIATEGMSENDAIYDLQGVRVAHPTKGVYIKNGKKYVVK